jgi:pyroglutamyl-peptidase
MTSVLIIGFGPFPGAPHNPSADLVRMMGKRRRAKFAGARIITAVLPTSYAAVRDELPRLLRENDPDAVLFFGLASRTRYLRIERRAVNAVTNFYPDMTRAKSATRTFMPGLPAVLAVRANVIRLVHAARLAGADARLSRDAGRYICNAALYSALHAARGGRPLVAFVHIPRPQARVRSDAMRRQTRPSLEMLARAGDAILAALLAEARRG